MSNSERYVPGPASGATIDKDGEKWTLVVVRELRHSPETVWKALTDPAQLTQWAPFDADRNLGTAGATVTLTTIGAPQARVSETTVTRADAPRLLEYRWGDGEMRWQLEPSAGGTRLTLWHDIGHRYIAMGAAGWHLCFDVLARALAGAAIGRMVGIEVMKLPFWQGLHTSYAKLLGVGAPNLPELGGTKPENTSARS